MNAQSRGLDDIRKSSQSFEMTAGFLQVWAETSHVTSYMSTAKIKHSWPQKRIKTPLWNPVRTGCMDPTTLPPRNNRNANTSLFYQAGYDWIYVWTIRTSVRYSCSSERGRNPPHVPECVWRLTHVNLVLLHFEFKPRITTFLYMEYTVKFTLLTIIIIIIMMLTEVFSSLY